MVRADCEQFSAAGGEGKPAEQVEEGNEENLATIFTYRYSEERSAKARGKTSQKAQMT